MFSTTDRGTSASSTGMLSRKIVVPKQMPMESHAQFGTGNHRRSNADTLDDDVTILPWSQSLDGLNRSSDVCGINMTSDLDFVALLDKDIDLECGTNSSFDSVDILESPASHSDGQIFSHSQGTTTSDHEDTQPAVVKKKHYRKRAAPKPPIPANNQGSTDSENWVVVNTPDPEYSNFLSVPTPAEVSSVPKPGRRPGVESRSPSGSPSQSPRSRPKSLHLKLPNFIPSPKNKHVRKNSKHEKKKDQKKIHKNGTVDPSFLDCFFVCLPENLDQFGTEFEVRRLPRYEHHLKELLEEIDESHPDWGDLTRALERVKQMVVEDDVLGDGSTEMETIQDRFPHDDLQLTKREQFVHSLQRRRRSAPSALLFKKSKSGGSLSSSVTGAPFRKDDYIQAARLTSNRYIIKEGQVQLARQGAPIQERYLFLFNDVLLIAKPKSGNTFKLKHRLRVCELWTSTCVEEIADGTRYLQQSFVLGWPITNQLVTCATTPDRDSWLQALQAQIEVEKQKLDHRTINISVYSGEDFEQMKELHINIRQDAKDILNIYVDKCQIPEAGVKDLQLWVMPGREEGTFPLIGHEIPYSICTSAELEGETVQCSFCVKSKKVSRRHGFDEIRKHKGKTFLSLFKRSSRDSAESEHVTKLFGQPLDSVMEEENLPKPVMTLLSVLCRHGPQTQGILRKSANEKVKKDLRQRLDDGEDCVTENTSCHIVGALVKDYLRSIPEGLLLEDLYEDWVAIDDLTSTVEKTDAVKNLFWQLPVSHQSLLKYLMCVLHHIEKHSQWNNMDASNLSICMAQSMLRGKATMTQQPSQAVKANALVQFMIEHCVDIFGEEVTMLLECAEDKQDSGTDTDSIPETNGNLRQDDSSIDSLEKDDPHDSSPHVAKSHLSPVNLSNDSGVTLSDSQLIQDERQDHRGIMYRKPTPSWSSSESLQNTQTSHRSVGKRCSADSLCSVEESSELEGEENMDVVDGYHSRSFASIVKSVSGDHLYPTTEAHPTEALSDSEIQSHKRERLVRQSSVASSTPPLSPQPKLSYSSDSLLSDSSASYHRDNELVHSTSHIIPQRQKYEHPAPVIVHQHTKQTHETDRQSYSPPPPFSHLSGQRRYSDESIQYQPSPNSLPRQLTLAHQSPDTSHRHSIHSHTPSTHHQTILQESEITPVPDYTSLSLAQSDGSIGTSRPLRQSWDKQLISGSPPPRILLQTFSKHQNRHGGRSVISVNSPKTSSYNDTAQRASSPDSPLMESRIVSVTRKQHNVIKIKSKSAHTKSVKPQHVTQLTIKPRPQHPPPYQEALDRKERMSKGLPVDVSPQETISQKRASAHAKQLYEQSLREYMKDSPHELTSVSSRPSSSSSDDDNDCQPDKDPKKVYEESMKQFLEQQSSTSTSRMSPSSSADIGVSINPSHEKVHVADSHLPQTFPEKTEHRRVIHIPSVRDSKLLDIRNRGLPSVSSSSSRSRFPEANSYFYKPREIREDGGAFRVFGSHQNVSRDSRTSDLHKPPAQSMSGLSWSVADLRRNYDHQNKPQDSSTRIVTVNTHKTGCHSSVKRPPPPPYNHPPPFRRNSDSVRQSSSSNSSVEEDSTSTQHGHH